MYSKDPNDKILRTITEQERTEDIYKITAKEIITEQNLLIKYGQYENSSYCFTKKDKDFWEKWRKKYFIKNPK